MFEVQCRVLEISEERDILLVTTSRDAFATILATLNENNAISYEAIKKRLNEKYLGEEYKRHLESKLRNLKFRAGTKIQKFLHDLRSTIRDYYGLTSVEQIDQIGMNHIYFLLLRILFEKTEQFYSSVGTSKLKIAAAANSVHNNERLLKLENLVEKLTNQVSQLASNKNDSINVNICSNCKKAGHEVSKCCFICQEK